MTGDELPDNQYTRYYYDLKDRLEKNPNLQGPLTNMILSILLLAAKYGHYADMMPGRFAERLDTDEDLKDKKLNKDQAEKVCEGKGETEEATLAKLAEAEKKLGKNFDMDKASTKYACNILWGIDDIDNAASLAASLKHTGKETSDGSVSIYEISTLEKIKQQDDIARGTILIFIPDLKKGAKIVAFATGAKDEFKYFDADTDKPEIFHLRGDDSKVKSDFGLMAFTPNTEAYKAAQEIQPEGETPAAAPTEGAQTLDDFKKTADAALSRLEKDNQSLETMLTDLELNPNSDNLIYLLTSAEATEADAQKTLTDIQKQADASKSKLSAEEQKVIDEYLVRLKAIAEQAKMNADHARDLESRI
ncbi:MAG: hypothetical protein AAB953_03465 [Patescibacteria group bacterium]